MRTPEEEITQAPADTVAPAAGPQSKFKDRLEQEIHTLSEDARQVFDKVVAGVEDWYTRHYHQSAKEGKAPISAKEKDDLVKTVTASVTQ